MSLEPARRLLCILQEMMLSVISFNVTAVKEYWTFGSRFCNNCDVQSTSSFQPSLVLEFMQVRLAPQRTFKLQQNVFYSTGGMLLPRTINS